MAVTQLIGLVDPNVFVDGYTPHGPEVAAEYAQLINKINEAIILLNTNEAGIATNLSLIGGNSSDISDNQSDIASLQSRATILESAIGNSANRRSTSWTPSVADCLTVRWVIMGGGGTTVTLPSMSGGDVATLGSSPNPLTIVSTHSAGCTVTNGTAIWADGSAHLGETLSLAQGESVTVYPAYDTVLTTPRWAMIAGKTYSDLA